MSKDKTKEKDINNKDAGREKLLNDAIAQIEKNFGKGSIMKMDSKNIIKIDSVSTGSLLLDDAIGIGGLPCGRVVEIYGPESSGKTTLTLQVIAEAQKLGKTCAFIDAEHALDPTYAQKLGVNINKLIVSQPDTGEQAFEIADTLARSGAVDVIVVDSVAALTPKVELEGEMSDANVGIQARMMSKGLRKLTSVIKNNNVLCIFINQLRMKIGVMFGNPETTTGGNALKFYASVRLDIRRTGSVKDGDVEVGNTVKIKVVKNKVAPPFKVAETQIMFGTGIDIYSEVIDLAVRFNIIQKSGAWYAYEGEKVGQGKENVKKTLKQDTALYNKLYAQIIEALNNSREPIEVVEEEFEEEFEESLDDVE